MCIKGLSKIFTGTIERPSPSDIIPSGNIKVTGNRVEIDLDNIHIPFVDPIKLYKPSIPDTNSMDPVYDIGHTVIYIKPMSKQNHKILCDSLEEGDIAVYCGGGLTTYTHRIIKIGEDEEGRYFRFKGDNNPSTDPFIVRDNQIMYIGFAIIY